MLTLGRRDKYAYKLISPSLIILISVLVVPLLFSLVTSFMKYNLLETSAMTFTGFKNYLFTLSNKDILSSLKITLIYVSVSVTIEMVFGTTIALILNMPFFGYKIVRVIILLPMLTSPAVTALSWRLILHPQRGVLNYLLSFFGVKNIVWLSAQLAFPVLVAIEVWMFTPFVTLMVLAGLQGISEEVLEASIVDGANGLQRTFKIVLPMVKPVLKVALIFRTIFALRNFPLPWVLTGGGPANATNVFGIELYKQAFRYYDVGIASAMSWILVVITASLSIFYIHSTTQEPLQ